MVGAAEEDWERAVSYLQDLSWEEQGISEIPLEQVWQGIEEVWRGWSAKGEKREEEWGGGGGGREEGVMRRKERQHKEGKEGRQEEEEGE